METSLPHDDEAERAVLGMILVDNEQWDTVSAIIGPEDFFRQATQTVWWALERLSMAGAPMDLLGLVRSLRTDGTLETVGGAGWVSALTDGIPRAGQAGHYAGIVLEASQARAVMRACSSTVEELSHRELTATEALDLLVQKLFELERRGDNAGGGFKTMPQVMQQVRKRMEAAAAGTVGTVGFGLTDLDRLTGGMSPGNMVVIAARPSVGKSALAVHIAKQAVDLGKRVGVVSLEMENEQLGLRLACSMAQIDMRRALLGELSTYETETMVHAMQRAGQWKLWMDDSPDLNLSRLRSRCRRLAADNKGLDLIVIDYLQLLQGDEDEASNKRAPSREQEVARLSKGIKKLAKSLQVPVVALAQLGRGAELKKRPGLSDLRESGAIEADADMVILLYRGELYDKEAPRGVMECIVAKNRNGPIGVVECFYNTATQRIGDRVVERDDEDQALPMEG